MKERAHQKTWIPVSMLLFVMTGTASAGTTGYPFEVGQRYEYRRSDSTGDVWTVLFEVKDQATFGVFDYFHIQVSNYRNDAAVYDRYFRVTEEALYSYNPSGPDYLQHQEAPVGTKWSHYQADDMAYVVTEITAIEPVTVPYGTFDKAYVYRKFQCEDPDDLSKGRTPYWYNWVVPGVGYVKELDYWNDCAPAVMELVSITPDLEPRCPFDLLGDLNYDCRVDFSDFALMASNWLIDCEQLPVDPACVPK